MALFDMAALVCHHGEYLVVVLRQRHQFIQHDDVAVRQGEGIGADLRRAAEFDAVVELRVGQG